MKNPVKILLSLLVAIGIAGCEVPVVLYLDIIAKTTGIAVEDGDTLVMSGEINSKTPKQIREVFAQNPGIKTIRMEAVPGSLNDDANLEIALFVAEQNITTHIGRYSLIASGGVDFFLAGENRIVEEGAVVGVHSWGGLFGVTATKYPRDHEYHQPYIDFYQAAGLSRADSEKFYFFTIESAPAGELHMMSAEEIIEYKITTTGISPPAYIIPAREKLRRENGYDFISNEEATRRGIEIREEAIDEDTAWEVFLPAGEFINNK